MHTSTFASATEIAAIQIAGAIAEKGWAVTDGFIPIADVRLLADDAERRFAAGSFHAATVGSHTSAQLDTNVRRDQIFWLDADDGSLAQHRYAASMETLRTAVNQRLYLGLLDLDAHFAIYEAGAFYETHHDRPRDAAHRTLSCIVYLNEHWCYEDGGLLRLYLEEPDREPWIDIEPVGGRLVCFLSERFHHQVLPVVRRRIGLSGWFVRRHQNRRR